MPLVALKPYKSPRLSAASQVSMLTSIPAPVGGLNFRDPISEMPPTDAMVMDNFIPQRTGCLLRKGWSFSCNSLTDPVTSLFSYNAADSADNRLFAASGGSIWDVTGEDAVEDQASTGSTDGIWSTTQFALASGEVVLLAVSPGAGYWVYEATSGWTQKTPTNLPTDLLSVAVWKNRVWFTENKTSTVWYLEDIDAIDGIAVAFEMGSLLRNGGSVRGLINWTLDSGVGVDDYLVVVGTEGDVGVWQGTDPTSAATFGLKGVWYVGPVPAIGRFFTAYGGDVMILSELGLVPMSRLVNGQFSEIQPGPSSKIQNVLSPIIVKYRNDASWDVIIVPNSDVLIIKLPPQNGIYVQYAMNVNTGAWCTFSGMPMVCTALLNGQLYFATDDKGIAKGLFGEEDGLKLDLLGGDAVAGNIQGAFNAFEMPGRLKKFTMVRPVFITEQAPGVKLRMNTQYSFTSVAGTPSFSGTTFSEWDTAVWGIAKWSGVSNTYESWFGVSGLGYYGAVRMRVKGIGGSTTLSSYHVLYEPGGIM